MESKKINQLATAVNPSSSDLAIIGDPVTGVSKKITWLQVSTLIGTAANLQQVTDNGSTTTNPITIGGLTITGLSTGVLKSDSGVISSVPFGAANGVATLAGDGKVPSSQLPSYVDDVVEVANYAALPVTGETGKIYITLDNNKVYRWGGSVYVEVAANQAVWGSITGTLANQTDLQNVLNAKVPTSRTITINGTSYDLSANRTWSVGTLTSVGLTMPSGFSVASSPLTGAGGTIAVTGAGASTQYIDGTGALQTFPTLLSSDNLVKLVRNQSGATMTAGTIVYISGATGNKPLIAKALATGDATSAQTYGLLQTDIANNADGYVVIIGNIGDLDTSALTEGQQLYLSGTTAGAWTTTKPYAPTHLVYVGIVLRSHPNQGIIGVKIQNGYEMDELHNVDAQSPSNNDILSYNTSTSLWEHKQIATTLGFTPISLSSLSATSPLSYNNTTGAFSIQVATASQNGYLSSTDFSTFNNKQAALGGTGFVKISGSTISYDNSTYYLASNPSAFITLASLSAGTGISYSNTTGVISSTITQYTDALARAAISSSATGLTYTSSTGVFSLTAGYAIPTTAKQTEWDTAYTNRITSLTTTGSSGAATLVSNTLNVPTYTLSGLGGQPLDADLTAIAGLSGTSGFLKKNAADTWSLDTNTYVTTTTAQTISGAKTFSASPIIDGGFATAIPLRFKQYDSASFNSDGYTDLYVMNAYRFGFAFNQGSSNYKGFTFNVNGITLNTSREYTMPDAAGTLALTSDIPSLANYVTLNGTQTISGNKTFSGINSFTGYTSFSYASTFMNGTSLNWTAAGSHTAGSLTLSSAHSGSTSSLILSDGDTAKYIYFSFTNTATGIKTYTLPDTSGTIALTSNLSSYVPYTGATAQLNMGDNNILVGTTTAANNIRVLCSSGNGLTAETAGCKLMLEPQSLILTDKQFSNYTKTLIFRAGGLSASYTLTLPDATGTIALTSDIPTLAGLGGQPQLNGTGFVKASGTTISYDNSTYLTTTAADTTYLPLAGGTLTGQLTISYTGNVTSNLRTSSTGGQSNFQLGTDAGTNVVGIAAFSSAFTSSLQYRANGGYVYSNQSGGLTLHAEGVNSLYLATNSVAALTINSSQQSKFISSVSINNANFTSELNIYATTAPKITFQNSGANRAYIYADSGVLALNSVTDNGIDFQKNGTSIARFAATTGHFLIGTTSDLNFYTSWDSGVTRIGTAGILFSYKNNVDNFILSQNYYVNTAGNDVRVSAGSAANIYFSDGSIYFRTAGYGAAESNTSWYTPIMISSGGSVGMGATSMYARGNIRTGDNAYGSIDFFNNGFGYGFSTKFFTFRNPDLSEAYGLTNDYGVGTGAELAVVARQASIGNIGFYTGSSTTFKMRIAFSGTILIGGATENSFGSARSIQIDGSGGSLLETRYNGTSGLRIGSGSDHSYHHDPRNAEMRFATSDSTRFYIYGNGNYSFTGSNVSDRRAKDNISLLDITATDKIMLLEAKTYNMKNNPSQKRYGFIAQEVKQIICDLVSGNENDGYLGLDYDGLLTLTIKALQEQQKEIQILKQK